MALQGFLKMPKKVARAENEFDTPALEGFLFLRPSFLSSSSSSSLFPPSLLQLGVDVKRGVQTVKRGSLRSVKH